MLTHNNKITCYANSVVKIYHHISTCYANMYIIVITNTNYAISFPKLLNDFCLCAKRLYTFSYLYNIATRYYYAIMKLAIRKIFGKFFYNFRFEFENSL